MSPLLPLLLASALFQRTPSPTSQAAQLVVDGEDTVIARSCTVVLRTSLCPDTEDDGALRITADNVVVDFAAAELLGSPPETDPDSYQGIGIVITGRGVTLRNARVAGFRVGILARDADGLVLEDCDVSDNRRARLRSTPEREDVRDWLSPHANDRGEWRTNYGAGIVLEGGRRMTVRRCRARDVQNGLILERVQESLVYDNDFSFLSGWGIALWRSERNMITRNATDFCIRGYSHGIYNRGQDSAGILLFEQCNSNVIAENSATHCGDGLFAFAGKEALGETESSGLDHTRLGNNDNIIARNDFSYAAAHGLELTFSFGNRLFENRLVGNAICGVWAGYSRDTVIAGNLFAHNGDRGYGQEHGGINIEHGQRNLILKNEFLGNTSGVHLWWDPDETLAALPWSLANGHGSGENLVALNTFRNGPLGIHLRAAGPTTLAGNSMQNMERESETDDASTVTRIRDIGLTVEAPEFPVFGETRPFGARAHLAGRDHILLDEWGPADWERPGLWRAPSTPDQHIYHLVMGAEFDAPEAQGPVHLSRSGDRVLVSARAAGVVRYTLQVPASDRSAPPLEARGVLFDTRWRVRFFAWQADPRTEPDAWRAEAATGIACSLRALNLPFGYRGPSTLPALRDESAALAAGDQPEDRFGTLAETELTFPAGSWELRTLSDDGLRMWIDDELVIDDWTQHGTREHSTRLEIATPRRVALRIEHFELDGAAQLSLDISEAR